jgi:hypothetical protein
LIIGHCNFGLLPFHDRPAAEFNGSAINRASFPVAPRPHVDGPHKIQYKQLWGEKDVGKVVIPFASVSEDGNLCRAGKRGGLSGTYGPDTDSASPSVRAGPDRLA